MSFFVRNVHVVYLTRFCFTNSKPQRQICLCSVVFQAAQNINSGLLNDFMIEISNVLYQFVRAKQNFGCDPTKVAIPTCFWLSHLHGQKLKRLAFVSGNFNGGMTAKNINERINTVVTVSKRIYNSGSSNDYSQL